MTEAAWGAGQQPHASANRGWGSVLARAVNAEHHTSCAGGSGLVRNYTDRWDARTMPDVYDLVFIDSNPADTTPNWDPSLCVPDAILTALGTNDFSPGEGGESDPREALPAADLVAAYTDLIDRLNGYYPGVHVFLVSSPMLGDEWPTFAHPKRPEFLLTTPHRHGTSGFFIGQAVYVLQGASGNVPLAAAFSVVPIVIMAVYLVVAKRMGAFDAL